jgi:hypothetical protein
MIDFLFALLGIAIALACLLPLLRTGGGMIAAFMRRTQVMQYAVATFAQLAALFAGALAAALISQDRTEPTVRFGAVILMLAIVYAADFAIRKTILKNTP